MEENGTRSGIKEYDVCEAATIWHTVAPDSQVPMLALAAHFHGNMELGRMLGEVEKEREQLQQDEQALKVQVEQLEKQIARERSELTRQQGEWDRKQKEMKSQLELMHACEAALTKKLAPLAELKNHIDEILDWRKNLGGRSS